MLNGERASADASTALRARTKAFALRILRVYESLPGTTAPQVLGKQLVRAGTSVGAHYREACRARSLSEFISKIEVGLQELDETAYWLELLVDGGFVPKGRVQELLDQLDELLAMLTASARTAKATRKNSPR
jgi:four helix bundle protein